MTPYETLLHFIRERESIRQKKEAGLPLPWTDYPILAQYRFCNVRREDDKETRWLHQNWLHPNAQDPDVWFAMAAARHVNKHETLAQLGYPVPWDPERFVELIRGIRAQKGKAYNAAYMIRASKGKEWGDKAEYLAKAVLGKLWENREQIRPVLGDTLMSFNQRLIAQFGLAGFMSGQIVADVKHIHPLREAADWWDFAVSGPGSRRGLNRILGRETKASWKEPEWHAELLRLRDRVCWDMPTFAIDAQNCQSLCCEIDKYLRTVNGEGRPKQKYVPA